MINKIRIIGGKWRGRKIDVLDLPNLRPTPDRVRETLFNWLQTKINGAHCLDAFAGTGALGFEALSRGAALVTFVDQSFAITQNLRKQAEVLQADNVEIYQGTSPESIKSAEKKFDIVFLDPPFKENLLLPTCEYLEAENLLADNCYIYIEANQAIEQNNLPNNWEIIKNKKAGNVFYHLVLRNAVIASGP